MIVNVGGRTDIVNYYSEWLMNRIHEEFAYSRNPLFQNNVSKISSIISCEFQSKSL